MNTAVFNLPEDMLSHIVGFLAPRDFYNLKTVISAGLSPTQRDYINGYYWWREEVPLTRAAHAGCPTLIRWVAANDPELEVAEIVHAPARSQPAAIALYDACAQRYPAALPQLLEQWVERGNSEMFRWQIARRCDTATVDVFDAIYLHSRWLMLAAAFQYNPREFVRWAFGGYVDVADPEVISNLRFVLHHLAAPERLVLIRILNKYHDWLWRTKIDRSAALQTIAALHELTVGPMQVIPFEPSRHFQQAVASPQHDFLEYLLLRGLEVEPDMMQHTHDIKKLRLIMTAQVVQKYQKIMVMLLILIVALVVNVFRPAEPVRPILKIETR